MCRKKLLLATESRILGEALSTILYHKGYEVIVHCGNLLQFSQASGWERMPIMIMEEQVMVKPEYECLDYLSEASPRPRCAFIIHSGNPLYLVQGVLEGEGVNGFIHKESGIDELVRCIRALEDGYSYISPRFAGRIPQPPIRESNGDTSMLTIRETQIVRLIKENKTSPEIGRALNLSIKTIQNHRQNICNKLGLKGRNRLYEYAREYF